MDVMWATFLLGFFFFFSLFLFSFSLGILPYLEFRYALLEGQGRLGL